MKQGDIVVLDFPFADTRESKKRPAVVISNTTYNTHNNILFAGIYGKATPLSLPITNKDVVRGTMTKDSFVSIQNIASLNKMHVRGVVDALTPKTLQRVLVAVKKVL